MESESDIRVHTHRAGVFVELGVVVDVEDVGLAEAWRPRRRVVARRRHCADRMSARCKHATRTLYMPRLDSRLSVRRGFSCKPR